MKFGILFRSFSFWVGVHYSPYNRRVCVNLLPMLTVWFLTDVKGEAPLPSKHDLYRSDS